MLFVIHGSMADALQDPSQPDEAVIDALTIIARARREGKHLVIGELRTLEVCAASSKLSPTERGVYLHLYNNLPEMRTYFDNLVRRVEVVAADGVFESTQDAHSRVIRLSAAYFRDFRIVDATLLLCENQTDAEFYEELSEAYLYWSKLGHVTLQYEPRGGGGQTTSDEFESVRSAKNRLCLCIVESDRKSPDHDLGSTARAAHRVDTHGSQPLCELLILDARTVENIVPTIIYQETVWGDPNRMAAVLFLEALESSNCAHARQYWDVRNGLKLGEVLLSPPGSAFRQFWEPVAAELQQHARNVDGQCWSSPKCTCPADCECIIGPGLGQSILAQVTDFLQKKSNQKKGEMVRGALRTEWETLGQLIVAWCCGSSRLSSV